MYPSPRIPPYIPPRTAPVRAGPTCVQNFFGKIFSFLRSRFLCTERALVFFSKPEKFFLEFFWICQTFYLSLYNNIKCYIMKTKEERISDIDKQIDALKKQKEELFKSIKEEETALDKFKGTYNGKKLLEKYSLHTVGIWEVRGEDPNCDMGGLHIKPLLGYYRGSLGSVIETAVNLSGFWQWGAGGSITKKKEDLIIDLGN